MDYKGYLMTRKYINGTLQMPKNMSVFVMAHTNIIQDDHWVNNNKI